MSRKHKSKPGGALIARTNITAQMEIVATFVRCRTHPYYRGLRKPRADCLACTYIYNGRVHDPFVKTICVTIGPEKHPTTLAVQRDPHRDSCLACAIER
jgi:hypothetical protein